MKDDFYATKFVMQPCLHGCSMLPSWPANMEIPLLRVEWHSIYEAEISVPDQSLA
jgi:hypothetical protein